ncbi:hypothetical protein ATZ36_13725 [Candidatus Endomicrobiellum trichonymphae]|uniref:Uncharacterized protein n=1 Tax=Endomicrobium trichonymphae TaxID=1408204 RepID=A0A1E5IMC4_ENDTX|nr:hypothetical protein ATZ36_13725 [Candidatus Endomicrobium trichonymphae]
MPIETYTLPNGDKYIFQYTGKIAPDVNTVLSVYNGQSKDIRIKGVKVKKEAKDISTAEGIAKNLGRGLSFGLSRKAENNSQALDQWNKENPFKSIVADIAGSLPTAALPGGIFATGAKVLSKIRPLVAVATKLKLANKLKNVVNVLKKPVVKAATSGGAYSAVRSNIDSRDNDPNHVGRNTVGSGITGAILGGGFGFLGNKAGQIFNRNSTRAKALINQLGGEDKFRNLTASNSKLIESGDPLIASILKNSELSPQDKAILFKNFMKTKNQIPEKIDSVINELTPQKTQAQVMNKYKKVADTRYAQGDFTKPLEVKASKTEYKTTGNPGTEQVVQITKPVAQKTVVVKDGSGQVLSKSTHTQQPLGSNMDTMFFENGLPVAQRIKTETNSPKFKITGKPSTLKTTPQQVEYFDKSPFFSKAYKSAVQHNPAVMGKDAAKNKGWLNNNPSTSQLIAIRKELYEMMPIEKNKGLFGNAEQIQGEISEINKMIKATNPQIAKADQTFSRSKGVEKRYNEGLSFKGGKAGEEDPKATASFLRGIMEQIKFNRGNLSGEPTLNDIGNVFEPHIQKVLNKARPATIKRAGSKFRKLKNEYSNLAAAAGNPVNYEKALNLGGADIFRLVTMPKNATGRMMKRGLDKAERYYEHSPQEIMSKMYEPAQKLYQDTMKASVPSKKGKVLNSVMQAFADTGGRGIWGNRH